jgi:hypothetical protein
MSGNAASLHAEVSQCLARGSHGVVLNLQEATYIDSTWLGAIVQTFAKLNQAGGPLPEGNHSRLTVFLCHSSAEQGCGAAR